MKKYSALFLLLICTSLLSPAFAQSKKKEKKKKLSKKEMTSQLSSLTTNVESLKSQIASLQEENGQLKKDVDDLASENNSLKTKVTQAERQAETAKQSAQNAVPSGLGFKVQIGAYKNFNIKQYFDKAKSISTEDVDGYNKYVIGYFSTLEEAQAFEKDIEKMGIQDAWIVPFNAGQRISDEQAEEMLGRPFRPKNKGKK